MRWALLLTLPKIGRSKPARIAIVAMTVSSSMSVKPHRRSVGREFMFANDTVIASFRKGIYSLSVFSRKLF